MAEDMPDVANPGDLTAEDVEAEEATALPEREAMSRVNESAAAGGDAMPKGAIKDADTTESAEPS